MAPPSMSAPIVDPLITGPALVGIVLNWYLYGILTIQYYMYLNRSAKDSRWLRTIVHILFILDSFQTFITTSDMFFWFVYNFGNPLALQQLHYASIGGPFCYAIIACIVQIIYCWRMWVLARWRILPGILTFLSLVAFVDGIFVGIHDVVLNTVEQVDKDLDAAWLFLTSITDIVIACSMAYLLLKFRSEKTSRSTMAAVKRILILVVETNTITSVLAIVLVVLHLTPSLTAGKTNLFLTVGYILGKTYSNCFMVLLNQRLYYEQSRNSGHTSIEINTYSTTFTTLEGSNNDSLGGRLSGLRNNDAGPLSIIRFAESTSDSKTRGETEEDCGRNTNYDTKRPSGEVV